MLFVLQISPLALHLAVGLHLHMGLAPLKAVLLIDGYELIEQQGIGALGAIFWQDADEQ